MVSSVSSNFGSRIAVKLVEGFLPCSLYSLNLQCFNADSAIQHHPSKPLVIPSRLNVDEPTSVREPAPNLFQALMTACCTASVGNVLVPTTFAATPLETWLHTSRPSAFVLVPFRQPGPTLIEAFSVALRTAPIC